MATKNPPPKPAPATASEKEKKSSQTLEKRAEARAFLGKKGLATIDRMAPLFGPEADREKLAAKAAATAAAKAEAKAAGKKYVPPPPNPPGLLNAAALASAALAVKVGKAKNIGGIDVLAEFRVSGSWKAPAIIAALDGEIVQDSRHRRSEEAPGLVSLARALLATAVYGGAKGVRLLCSAIARSNHLGVEDRRAVDGIGRLTGSRNVTVDQLRSVLRYICLAAGPRQEPLLERAARVLELCDSVRPIGNRERNAATPRQLIDMQRQEAGLIAVDLPVREPTIARGPREFGRVVVLARTVAGDLVLIDAAGLFDPVQGKDDPGARVSLLPRSQEVVLCDYLSGTGSAPPMSPVARLIYGGYLSAVPPASPHGVEVALIGGSVFHYC
ncbi:MAG: hypothetical protein JXR83_14415 [Deltaproteobacteria bacterium]|nr:hypothetical protein [Deltaproteobacteria bacterium]